MALVQNLIKVAPEFPRGVRQLPSLVETRTYDAEHLANHEIDDPSFVACHFFRAAELRDLLANNGIAVDAIVGLERPASNLHAEIDEASEENQERIRDVVQAVREGPTFADLSEHVLAVGRVR